MPAAAATASIAYERELRQAEAATQAAMEQAARRAAEIELREQALRQRERELAEQRRILAEEYRLLRMQRAAGAPPAGAPVRQHAHNVRSGAERFAPARPGLWAWVKRVASGGSHRAIEGH